MFNNIHYPIKPSDVIDVHVHIGGPSGENERMYYWSDKFTNSLSFEAIKLVTKLSASQVTGARYMSILFSQLKQSKYVDKIVLLGLDQVYSEEGYIKKEATHLYVSNDYLIHLTEIYQGFLFGCSVHPYSPDALERLWYCAKNGAVLCKWLPSSQSIDPTHPLSVKFYQALAELKLPLLIHVGPEETIPCGLSIKEELLFNAAAGKYGSEPGDAISMALEAGATIIVAHCATPLGSLFNKYNRYWEEVFETLLKRVNLSDLNLPLYADISAFCLPSRFKYVKKIIPIAKEMPQRFLYGSDYPIPIVSFNEKKVTEEILQAFGWLAGRALPTNDFDKNYQLLKPHFADQTFTAAARVLRNPQSLVPDLKKYLSRLGIQKRITFGQIIKNVWINKQKSFKIG